MPCLTPCCSPWWPSPARWPASHSTRSHSRTERLKIEAARLEAIRQQEASDRAKTTERRVEHLRWRRDRRQAACIAFLLAFRRIIELGNEGMTLHAQGIPDRDRAEEVRTAITAALKDGNAKLAAVQLEGPRALANTAVEFADMVSFIGQWVRDRLTDQTLGNRAPAYAEFGQQALEAEAAFLEEAEKALAELLEAD